ncbi:putative uncharacterized protein DDB_G0290521 isoform X2 [Frankliniella occidentalis]|uniref:Uncharacterized protein n=1 Tax=Frankliniella occidentalis TaxID=133901 RepID=A0A9C6X636_FRAOC|nr:putative uncharacterized protein DDB_G0290521 isoform X2 [Frankliniella occidentalis]
MELVRRTLTCWIRDNFGAGRTQPCSLLHGTFLSLAPADASAHAPTASMAPHTPATPKRAPSATPQRTPAATPTLLRTPSSTTPMRTRAATPIQIPAPSTQTMTPR